MNKLTRIEELARKLNQEILALEVVQEYQKYEKLVLNDEKLKQLEKELKAEASYLELAVEENGEAVRLYQNFWRFTKENVKRDTNLVFYLR